MNKNNKDIIFFCPYIQDGGVTKTLINYLNFFSKKNKVSLITNTFNNKQLKLIDKKVNIKNLEIKTIINFRLINIFFVSLYLLRFINKNTVIFSLQDHFFLLLFKFLGLKKKLVIRTPTAIINKKNTSESKHLNRMHFLKKIFVKFYKYSDLVITFSEDNKKYLKSFLNVKNVCVVYNYFPKHGGKKKIKKIYNIFFIGRLTKDKDPTFFMINLIKLFKLKNFTINIVGKGERINELKNIAKQYKKNIKFYGYIKDPLIKLHRKIDIVCVTSKFDGTPNILGEALSYKIPCVAPDKVGLSNLLFKDGAYSYIYKPGNNISFQKTILKILNDYRNAIKKAEKGYLSLDRFNKKNTLGKLENIINKICFNEN